MIVIKDLSQKALDELMSEIDSVCYNVADMGAPETYRVTLNDQAIVVFKASNDYVWIGYGGGHYELNLSEFAKMEIL